MAKTSQQQSYISYPEKWVKEQSNYEGQHYKKNQITSLHLLMFSLLRVYVDLVMFSCGPSFTFYRSLKLIKLESQRWFHPLE